MANIMMVYFLSLRDDVPKRGFWDYGLIEDLLEKFPKQEVSTLEETDTAIVVIPARSHAGYIKEINQELKKIKGVILFLMGDEESIFPIEKIKHNRIKIWVQNARPGKHDDFTNIGTGYPAQIHNINKELPKKDFDFFFAGQITHSRREEMKEQIENMGSCCKGHKGYFLETKGFGQGLSHEKYYEKMARAKIVPCPSGPQTPDSFRLFEALELGCVPIADNETPKEDWTGFWEWLFDEPVPFSTINNWDSFPGYVKDITKQYPAFNNRVQSFWLKYKQKLKDRINKQIIDLGGKLDLPQITAIIPISPIPSHPDTRIIEETIKSIRYHLPDIKIILTFDGVREEQKKRCKDYEENIRRTLWLSRYWGNITPYIFEEHSHQSGMAKEIISKIDTPLILYIEQDTPLVTDETIEWEKLSSKILNGDSNLIRFHFEAKIPQEHEHLIIGNPEDGLLKTVQWSQRPHLASTAFYKRILSEQFSPKSRCFLEDLLHGKVLNDWHLFKEQGWNQWRIHIYYPKGNIKRSYTTDGRENAPKYDDTQIW